MIFFLFQKKEAKSCCSASQKTSTWPDLGEADLPKKKIENTSMTQNSNIQVAPAVAYHLDLEMC